MIDFARSQPINTLPKSNDFSLPESFKGIALFTPGGDSIYGIDANRQARWHIHLCSGLQKIFGLPELPHFLVPGYTATVERWRDPQTQQLKVIAEAYPAVRRYLPLLDIVFGLKNTGQWKIIAWQEEYCSQAMLETYRQQFPQLWEERDLLVRLDPDRSDRQGILEDLLVPRASAPSKTASQPQTDYILRLFISGSNPSAEQVLADIHQLLERGLAVPYTLKVIDLDKHPQQGHIEGVMATPTLIRVSPTPVKRVVGELNNVRRVLEIISS